MIGARFLDPAVGTGDLLIEVARHLPVDPTLAAPRMRPSRASLRTLRSDTAGQAPWDHLHRRRNQSLGSRNRSRTILAMLEAEDSVWQDPQTKVWRAR